MTGPRHKKTADELAKFGRYGDDMLVHMNRYEVEGLASLSPTGKLTVNPETGQPEAFLPFLAPILGSVLGKAFIPAAASKVGLGSLVGGKMASAIGSGLARWAESGSLEKGLLSGITGYGLGNAMQGVGEGAGVDEVTALNEGVASTASPQTWGDVFQQGTTNLRDIGGNLGTVGSQLMTPGSMLPIAYGEGQIGQMEMENLQRERAAQLGADREAEYERARQGMLGNVYGATSRPPRDYGIGSLRPIGMVNGGLIEEAVAKAEAEQVAANNATFNRQMDEMAGGIPAAGSAAARQASLRGSDVVAPPPGFRPGLDAEFMYFSEPAAPGPPLPPSAPAPTPLTRGQALRSAVGMTSHMSELSRPDIPGVGMTNRGGDLVFGIPGVGMTARRVPQGVLERQQAEQMLTTQVEPDMQLLPYELPGVGMTMTDSGRPAMPGVGMTVRRQGGGPVPSPDDAQRIVQSAAMAILGRMGQDEADAAINTFLDTFGQDAFETLREQVLQGNVPGAQTEGMVRGNGGGMDDQVPGMIGDQQPVAVSPGEFIVPADVVSGLGDGSSDAGAERLDELIESVRMARTGTSEQPAPIRESMAEGV